MGPYRELFVDAEDAIERERIAAVARSWEPIIRMLYPPTESKALRMMHELDIEERIKAYVRLGDWPLYRCGLTWGLSDL